MLSIDQTLRASYTKQGFVVVKGLVDDFVPEIRRLVSDDDSFRAMAIDTGRYELLRARFPLLNALCSDLGLIDACRSVLNGDVCYLKDKLICKPPGAGGFEEHRDMEFGWGRFVTEALTAVIPLDPMTVQNGCLELLPGSHTDRNRTGLWKTAEVNVGDVLLFDGWTLHRSGPNRSPANRSAYFITCNAATDGNRHSDYYEWMQQYPQGVRREDVLDTY